MSHHLSSNPPTTHSSSQHSHESTTTTTSSGSTMPPTPPPPPSLTLILAATPSLGIGKSGGLPWPQLKKEMGYFARVTKRVSPDASNTSGGVRRINAVLMGRKTWESIPPRFRPLKDRLNVVVTRRAEEMRAQLGQGRGQGQGSQGAGGSVEGPLICSGILDALSQLSTPALRVGNQNVEIDRVFVIGGASVYQTALELPQTNRVLLTKIRSEFECDTFFPVDLERSEVWRRAGREEVEGFTGERVGEEGVGVEEGGVGFEFCMFVRE